MVKINTSIDDPEKCIQDAWEIYFEELNKDKCKNCDRKILEDMRTKKGCIWCDINHHKGNKNG